MSYMPHIRDILNEIKWTKDLDNVKIWYVHRGAPNDTKILCGKEIINIGKSFVDMKKTSIPYHRIFKITCDEKIIFKR